MAKHEEKGKSRHMDEKADKALIKKMVKKEGREAPKEDLKTKPKKK